MLLAHKKILKTFLRRRDQVLCLDRLLSCDSVVNIQTLDRGALVCLLSTCSFWHQLSNAGSSCNAAVDKIIAFMTVELFWLCVTILLLVCKLLVLNPEFEFSIDASLQACIYTVDSLTACHLAAFARYHLADFYF